jgi:hypothetical protein
LEIVLESLAELPAEVELGIVLEPLVEVELGVVACAGEGFSDGLE